MTPISFVLRHRALRLIAVALLLLGALNASAYPYQSVIAIERLGMSKPAFSLMLVMASLIAVTSSVLCGVLGDQFGHRRTIALGTAMASTLGIGLIVFFPGIWALILCQGILLPLASSMYGQLIALARLAGAGEGQAISRDALMGVIRAAMSLSFLAMLVFWTFAFGFGLSELAVYFSAGAASLGLLALIWASWPKNGKAKWQDPRSGLRLHHALAEIAKPHVALRVALLGALASSSNLYMVLVSLVFDASPLRGPSDVALYVGMTAGWEVPAMLILPRFTQRMSRSASIALGAAVYAVHLVAMPLLTDTPFIWAMTLVAGFGGATIITGPIPYYQDLLAERPGTAAAMLAVQKLVADVFTAAVFALGSQIGGFGWVASLGAAVSLMGAAGIYTVDRKGWILPKRQELSGKSSPR